MSRERHKLWLGLWAWLVLFCWSSLGRGSAAARLGTSNATFPDWNPSWSACSTSKCYIGISTNSDFLVLEDVIEECQKKNLVLARIDDREDLKLLNTALWSGVWIGLRASSTTNSSVFAWQDGTEPTYTNWDVAEPYIKHKEQCVIAQQARSVYVPAGTTAASPAADGRSKWVTSNCDNTFPFVCQLPPGADTTHCTQVQQLSSSSARYCLANATATWQAAKQRCMELGGQLAEVSSALDQPPFTSTFSTIGATGNSATLYWIGVYNPTVITPERSAGCNNPSDRSSGSCSGGQDDNGNCQGWDQSQATLIRRNCNGQNLPLCSSGSNSTTGPVGFQEAYGTSLYAFMVKPRAFPEAQLACEALNATLAVPESDAEYRWLVQTAGRYMRNTQFYVGLRGDGYRVSGAQKGYPAQLWGGGLWGASPASNATRCMSLGGWSEESGHWWAGAWWPRECSEALPFVCKQEPVAVDGGPAKLTPGSETPPRKAPTSSSKSVPMLVPVLAAAVVGMILLGCLMAAAFICMGRPSMRGRDPPKPPMRKPSTASLLWVWFSRRPKPPPKALLPLRMNSAAESAPITSPGGGARSLRSPLATARSYHRSVASHASEDDASSSGGSAGRTHGGSPTNLSSDHSSSASAAAAAAIAAANAASRSAATGGRSLTAALAAAGGGAIGPRGGAAAAAAGTGSGAGSGAFAAAGGDGEEALQVAAVEAVPYRSEGGGLLVYSALPDVLAAEAAAGPDSGAGVILDSDPVRSDVTLNLALGKHVTVHFDQVLGRGSSGAVYRGSYGARTVAVKVLDTLWLDGPKEGAARVGASATARDLRRRLSAMSASVPPPPPRPGAPNAASAPGDEEAPASKGGAPPSLLRWYTEQQREKGASAIPPPPGLNRSARHSRGDAVNSPSSSVSSGSLSFLRPPSVPFSAPPAAPPQPTPTPPGDVPIYPYPVANPLYGIQASPPLTPTSPNLSNAAPAPQGPLPSHSLLPHPPSHPPSSSSARPPAVPSLTRQSLQQEFSILSRVRHPNIIELLGGGLQAREAFLVMELMDCNLGTYVRRRGRLPAVEALSVMRSVAKGLWHLHPTIMHRDLKPENILLSDQGTVKIADFGMSRCKVGTMLFTDHLVAGTVPYMAPECYTGEAASEKADIFSLGVILWFCLTGRKPWSGWNSVAIMYQVGHMHQRPPLPTDFSVCPPEVADLIKACWAPDPRVRPPAIEVVRKCTSLIATLPVPVL